MDKKTIDELIDRVRSGTATDEELAAYNDYLNQATDAGEDWNVKQLGDEDALGTRMLDEINSRISYEPKRPLRLWPRIAAAASVLVFLSIGTFFLLNRHQQAQIAQNPIHDIAPGRNQATLTLAGGQQIILTSRLNGQLARQANAVISVSNGRSLAYTPSAQATGGTVEYNTLSTSVGEQSPYPLVLADGTKVWLNAASSITFPTAFTGNERMVEVKGEAFFEVAHNARQPFRVKVKDQLVEDIGTQFNINAYDDEPVIRTSLVGGAVRVEARGLHSGVTLKPGQQARETRNGGIRVATVDMDGVTAWRNNYFYFDDNDLEGILRQVARWYDVKVVFASEAAKTKSLTGTISRYKSVNSVLRKLAYTSGLRFNLTGNTITVSQ